LDLNFHYSCRNIAHYFYSNLYKLEENISYLIASHVFQEYFFERFPLIDHMNNQIYRRAIKSYSKSKGTNDAFIFADSLIYLSDFLKSGKSGKIPNSISIKCIPGLHPFLQARLIGSLLIHLKNEKNDLISIAFDYAKIQTSTLTNEFHFPFFNYMMADYFVICKMYKEAIQMIELSRSINTIPTSWLESGYYETFELIYCIALEGNGDIKKAKDIFQKIDRSHFHFIFQKYFSIQYLNLKKKLNKKLESKEAQELSNLYNETKFHYLT